MRTAIRVCAARSGVSPAGCVPRLVPRLLAMQLDQLLPNVDYADEPLGADREVRFDYRLPNENVHAVLRSPVRSPSSTSRAIVFSASWRSICARWGSVRRRWWGCALSARSTW